MIRLGGYVWMILAAPVHECAATRCDPYTQPAFFIRGQYHIAAIQNADPRIGDASCIA